MLDVHVRHVESIPEGSDGQLVERISLSPAGTAGGTAVVLAKLGLDVASIGATGRDPAGQVLRSLLSAHGIDVTGLVERDEQTSASVLPVRPNGDRPAWHCIGANGAFTLDDVDLDAVAAADLLHLGGPEFLGGEAAGRLLAHARAHGTVTAVDLLAPGDPDMLAWVADALPHVDHFLPNDEQLRGLTGLDDLTEAGSRSARARRRPRRGDGGCRRRASWSPPPRRPRCRRTTSTSWTPRAAATPSAPATSPGSSPAAHRRTPRSGATRPRRRSSRGWRPTTVTTTSRRWRAFAEKGVRRTAR